MSIEKRLLKLFREEVENFGLTPHIKRVLEDEEYAAKQGGDKPDVSVEEFDNFMNGRWIMKNEEYMTGWEILASIFLFAMIFGTAWLFLLITY